MKVSELVEGIRKACGDKDPAECLMRVGYPVEEYDVPWTVTDLDVDGPNDRDRYGAPMGKTADVDVRLDIEDFEPMWPYRGLAKNASGATAVEYSTAWDASVPVMTAEDALNALAAEDPETDVTCLSDGKSFISAGIMSVESKGLKRPWPASPAQGAKRFSTWIVVFDGKRRTKASAADVDQYVETHEDEVRGLAYDKWKEDMRDMKDWADELGSIRSGLDEAEAGAVKAGMRPDELLKALGYDGYGEDSESGKNFIDALIDAFEKARCVEDTAKPADAAGVSYDYPDGENAAVDLWVQTPIVGKWTNNGIGPYEYWGSSGYDKGSDYVEFAGQAFDEDKFKAEAKELGFDARLRSDIPEVLHTPGGDDSDFEEWDEEDGVDPHYSHKGSARGTARYPVQLVVSDPAKAEAFVRSSLPKADGALGESAGIRVWAHMLDEAMEAK